MVVVQQGNWGSEGIGRTYGGFNGTCGDTEGIIDDGSGTDRNTINGSELHYKNKIQSKNSFLVLK